MEIPPQVVERIKTYLEAHGYDAGELMAVLGVSRYIAGNYANGNLDLPAFLALHEREGLNFIRHILGISKGELAAGTLPAQLRAKAREIAELAADIEADAAMAGIDSEPQPDVVERALEEITIKPGSSPWTWLQRWENGNRIEIANALKLAKTDPGGRVGIVTRAPRATFFTCRHVGSRLRFSNTSDIRLLGSTTADWAKNPYLRSCAESYAETVERERPLIQDVNASKTRGMAPTEPGFRRFMFPFVNRANTHIVIVVSETLQPLTT